MRLSLRQHIYASRGAYETIAESEGITPDIRRRIELKATGYPFPSLGTTNSSPLIYRGFPLTNDGDYAIMIMQEVTAVRREFLAHSYVLRRDDLEAVSWNLPWLACHLPFRGKFRARSGRGIDRLDPYALEFDVNKRFEPVRFVLRATPAPSFAALFAALIQSLDVNSKASVALAMPPRPHDLAQLAREYFGKEPPGPDVFNILCLSALFAFLPFAFQRSADFSINELAENPQFTVTVLREPRAEIQAATLGEELQHYLQFCHSELLRTDGRLDTDRIQSVLDAINHILTVPIGGDLCLSYQLAQLQLDNDMVVSSVGRDEKAQIVAGLLSNQTPPGPALLETAWSILEGRDFYPTQLQVAQQLAQRVFRDMDHPESGLVSALLGFFTHVSALEGIDQLSFIKDLPEEARKTWWRIANRKKVFPAWPVQERFRGDLYTPDQVCRWVTLVQAICDGLDWEIQKQASQRFVQVLSEVAIPDAKGDAVHDALSPRTRSLRGILHIPHLPNGWMINHAVDRIAKNLGHDHHLGHNNLQESQLAKADSHATEGADRNGDHNQNFFSPIWNGDSLEELVETAILRDYSHGYLAETHLFSVLERIVRHLSRDFPGCVVPLLMPWPKNATLRTTAIRYLQGLANHLRGEDLAPLVETQLEFLRAVGGEYQLQHRETAGIWRGRFRKESFLMIELPQYKILLDLLSGRKKTRNVYHSPDLIKTAYKYFRKNLADAIRGLPVAYSLPLAVSYLYADPQADQAVYDALADAFWLKRKDIAQWWRDESRKSSDQDLIPAIMVASFVRISYERPGGSWSFLRDNFRALFHSDLGVGSKEFQQIEYWFERFGISTELLKPNSFERR